MDLNIINEFPSASTAAKINHTSARFIKSVCERINHQKSCKGYIYIYKDEYDQQTIDWDYYLINNKSEAKPILQFDYKGNFIRRWNSLYEIQKELHYSESHILDFLLHKKNSHNAYGYFWKYDNNQELQVESVYYEQYKDGQLICDFNSIKNFCLQYNLKESSIQKCITGALKSNFGYQYKKVTRIYILK